MPAKRGADGNTSMIWAGSEQAGQDGPSVVAEGIIATTPIATPSGWCPAGELHSGAEVMTFDGGNQTVTRALTLPLEEPPPEFWPLRVPAWAMDNREDVLLLPEQKVLIEADCAEDLFGDPFALVPARALEGWRGIERSRPPQLLASVQLRFARHQLVYASRGILLSCAGDPFAEAEWHPRDFSVCSLAQARHLVTCLMAEEAGAALRLARQHPNGSLA
ncbi:Hint domain-containing protein [Pseudotabrizicola algicola]|uniref:Hedgehog/Intein (Hint) domain-containing protein n=1 Tax=Pseudotabrizicola algicola TaxID=2709381 RepID=A0A6B3RNC8_9RHOB|nr:Hint domain-containing protein [Pseudotabrizicola algicola]NEX47587.1 hypothetical protein [Pseudotabrizicola algicola]